MFESFHNNQHSELEKPTAERPKEETLGKLKSTLGKILENIKSKKPSGEKEARSKELDTIFEHDLLMLQQELKKAGFEVPNLAKDSLNLYKAQNLILTDAIAEHPNAIVRSENCERLLSTLVKNESFVLIAEKDNANSAVLGSQGRGLRVANNEGFDNSYGRTMTGVFCYPSQKLDISPLPKDAPIKTMKPDADIFRVASGVIDPKHIYFIQLRWPRSIFPKSLLTNEEKDEESFYISRVYKNTRRVS